MIKLRQERVVTLNGVETTALITLTPTFSTFPGGEEHVNVKDIQPTSGVDIFARIKSSQDLMRLLLCMNAIEHRGAWWNTLYIPYLPYARQDRVCNPGDADSLALLLDLMCITRQNRSGNIHQIVSMDIHNPGVMMQDRNITLTELLMKEGLFPGFAERVYKDFIVVSPDKGSRDRSREVAEVLNLPVCHASKVRNTFGKIIQTTIEPTLPGGKFLIVDDICDGGRTFIEIAKILKARGAERVELLVTHGIFSKGMEVFEGLIDHIYTTDSFCELESTDFLTVYPVGFGEDI